MCVGRRPAGLWGGLNSHKLRFPLLCVVLLLFRCIGELGRLLMASGVDSIPVSWGFRCCEWFGCWMDVIVIMGSWLVRWLVYLPPVVFSHLPFSLSSTPIFTLTLEAPFPSTASF